MKRNLGKLIVAILEEKVKAIIGQSAIDQLKAPLLEAEIQRKIEEAAKRAEDTFRAYPDQRVVEAITVLPLAELPSVRSAIREMLDRPLEYSGAIQILETQLSYILPQDFSSKRIRQAVTAYLKILQAELAAVDESKQKNLVAFALLRVEDQIREIAATSTQIQSTLIEIRDILSGTSRDGAVHEDPAALLDVYLAKVVDRYTFVDFRAGYAAQPLRLEDTYTGLPLLRPNTPMDLARVGDSSLVGGKPATDIMEILKKQTRGALVGGLGQGKTTTLQYLTLVYARSYSKRMEWMMGHLVPIYVPIQKFASQWNDEAKAQGQRGFIKALAGSVAGALGGMAAAEDLASVFEHVFQQDRALLLLDALDEYRATEAERHDFVGNLQSLWLTEPYKNNLMILTSRPHAFLDPYGFGLFTFQPLGEKETHSFVDRLGRGLLRARADLSLTDANILEWLKKIKQAMGLQHLKDFRTPFYTTLMIYLGAGEVSTQSAYDRLAGLQRLGDLYDHFLKATIQWETGKSNQPNADIRDCYLVLGFTGFHTFVEPLGRDGLEDAVAAALRLNKAQVREIIRFWIRAGMLKEDRFNGALAFQHSGFQKYSVALALGYLYQSPKTRRIVDDLYEQFEANWEVDPAWREWELIWRLYQRFISSNETT